MHRLKKKSLDENRIPFMLGDLQWNIAEHPSLFYLDITFRWQIG